MNNFSDYEEELKAPNPERIKFNTYRKGTLNKLLTAFNKLHNKEYKNEYRRNKETFDFLKDIEVIQPQVTIALKEEKELFEKVLTDIDIYLLKKHKDGLRSIRVGYWWWNIMSFEYDEESAKDGVPSVNYALPSGYCAVTLDKWSVDSWFHSACDSEDYHTVDSDRISWFGRSDEVDDE